MGSLGQTAADTQLYEELLGEVHRMLAWVKEKLRETLHLEEQHSPSHSQEGPSKLHPEVKEFLHDVRLHHNQVSGLISEGFHYLEHDPDTLLYIGVTDLDKNWQELKAKLRCLSRRNLNNTPSSQVNLYFVKQGSPVSPLYPKLPLSRERKISVDLPRGRSLLEEKGRTRVAKLSIPYRALIKSKVKSHWHRCKYLSDTGSEILISDTRSESSEGSTAHSEPDYKVNTGKDSSCASPVSSCSSPRLEPVSPAGSSEACVSPGRALLEKLRSRAEHAAANKTSNLGSMHNNFPDSFVDLSTELSKMEGDRSDRSASSSPRPLLGPRLSPPMEEDSPNSKRRKMNQDVPSCASTPSPSPGTTKHMFGPHIFVDPGQPNPNLDDTTDSNMSSPSASPSLSHSPIRDFRRRVKKDELWPAIKSDYQFLMDDEIIETCKSTESDFSWTDEDLSNTKVSFAEFMQQYKELTEWLNQIQAITQKKGSSLSEKYLSQSYHEEMLQRSPRRKLFNDYAKQLMRRYPSLKDEISVRLQHLNSQWGLLEAAISPKQGYQDEETMLKDLEQDLNTLRKWLHDVENQLKPSTSSLRSMRQEQIQQELQKHSVLQKDIESHSKLVSAVLKLCERLQKDTAACQSDDDRESLSLVAINLERRWHAIWLQSLEWQCRLEEALTRGKVTSNTRTLPGELFGEWDYFRYPTPEVSRGNASHYEAHDISKDDFDDIYEEDLYSDGNSDVIPFAESEYEKILVDTDAQTDNLPEIHAESSADSCGSGREQGCESMDTEIDSAYGRSVSDHSINADQIGRFLSKNKEAGMIFENKEKGKMEINDVGYSSESHSNEEQEKEVGRKVAGEPDLIEEEGEPDSAAVDLSVQEDSSKASNACGQWRHSMTSAYDTSSNCSDTPRNLQELDTVEDADPELSRDDCMTKLHSLTTSPSQQFYQVTAVETDSDAINTYPVEDREGNHDASEEMLNSKADSKREHERDVERTETGHVVVNIPIQVMADDKEGLSDEEAFTRCRNTSLDAEPDSDVSHQDGVLSCSSEVEGEPDNLQVGSPTESLKKLIQQAELLVMDERMVNGVAIPVKVIKTKAKSSRSRKRKATSRPRPKAGAYSTDGSMAGSEAEDSAASSCEAGSDYTGGSESEGDYSTASDLDDTYDHNISCSSSLIHEADSPRKIRRHSHRHRRKDVSLTHIDFSPISVSESAIYDMNREDSLESLQRTRSDTTQHHRRRKRRLQHTVSEDSQMTFNSSLCMSAADSTQISIPIIYQRASPDHSYASSSYVSDEDRPIMSARRRLEMKQQAATQVVSASHSQADEPDISSARATTDTERLQGLTTSAPESEQAWDHYQAPPYSVSDAPTEEKLDDSHLQWDDSLEYEEDFNLDTTYGGHPKTPERSPTRRRPTLPTYEARGDDSDSDVEELTHVIEESRRHLKLSEAAVKKNRKDGIDAGISLDHCKYAEVVATCDTNIKCLEVISDTLVNEEGLDNISDSDIKQVNEIIEQWYRLQSLAQEKQVQSKELGSMYRELVSLEDTLSDIEVQLNTHNFQNVADLEHSIQSLQQQKVDMHEYRAMSVSLGQEVELFAKDNPTLSLNKFKEKVSTLHMGLDKMGERCTQRISELQMLLLSWYDFNETQKELSYLMEQERQQLQGLLLAEELASLTSHETNCTIADLQAMKSEFGAYNGKLECLRQLCSDLASVSTEEAAIDLRANVALADNELGALRQKCVELLTRMEHRAAYTVGPNHQATGKTGLATDVGVQAAVGEERSLASRVLRVAIPLHLLLVALFGMAYLLDPDSCNSWGLTLDPQLRYVRGPPPT